MTDSTIWGEYELKKTCDRFPEQYDVFLKGKQVGALHVRWGVYTVYYPDWDGDLVFECYVDGDICFTDEEREGLINKGLAVIGGRI